VRSESLLKYFIDAKQEPQSSKYCIHAHAKVLMLPLPSSKAAVQEANDQRLLL
jgi:hypothetical protein